MGKFIGIILLAAVVFLGFLLYRYAPQFIGGFELSKTAVPESKVESPPEPSLPAAKQTEEAIPPAKIKPEIKISSISPKGYWNQYSRITLSVRMPENDRLNITGWKIKSNKDWWIIPKGSELYGASADRQDIYVKNGDRVEIYSHSNPLGANYRLNQCIGYIKNTDPPNPGSCASFDRSEITAFSGACQDYILGLGSCEVPEPNPPVPLNDYRCHEFLNKLTYQGCLDRRQQDKDFLSNEWRIWMTAYGSQDQDIFDPRHDRVQLFDREGNLMDEYLY